ncbi:MAG: HAD-IC family P-type ATPase, partial [Fusobacteriaceae bacterium]
MIYKDSLDKVFEKIKGTREGLTSLEAKKRLKENGYNQLKEKKKITILQLFLENFKDPLVIILLVAAAIQIVSGHLIDSLIILLVLILNAILGVIQTRKAEGSLDALKKLSAPEAKVLRDKLKISIPACDLVVGDIVFLDAGDYIPADGRILVAESLKVMEGILTGESEPILKNVDSIDKEVPLGDRKNMVFSGTMVVYGRGTLLVTNIGMETEIALINFAIKHKMDIDELRKDFQRIGELPFDSDRKIMSSVHKIGS